jgi:hypothetical protein
VVIRELAQLERRHRQNLSWQPVQNLSAYIQYMAKLDGSAHTWRALNEHIDGSAHSTGQGHGVVDERKKNPCFQSLM